MDLNQLDRMLLQRWLLLLHCYLPFFKTPSPFYLKCRNFINRLKKTFPDNDFPLQYLPELLLILEVYSRNKPGLIRFSKKIMATMNDEQYQQVDHHLLMQLLSEFVPNLHTPILNGFLAKLPAHTYQQLIPLIIASEHKKHFIKWLNRLPHRFSLAEKLDVVLSLTDKFVSQHIALINSFAISALQGLEQSALSSRNYLTLSNQENFLNFILKWRSAFKLSTNFLVCLLCPWLSEKNPSVLAYLNSLDSEDRSNFLQEIIAENAIISAKILLDYCPVIHYSALIDRLINILFESFKPNKNSEIIFLTEKPSPDDHRLTLLRYLETEHTQQLNVWQLLAISALGDQAITSITLMQLQEKRLTQLLSKKNFSNELEEYIAENRIKAVKNFILGTIFSQINRENTRQNLHRKFHGFFSDCQMNFISPLDEFITLTDSLPTPIQQQYQTDFFIIHQLLSYFSAFLAQPPIKAAKNYRLIATEKARADFAVKTTARQALTADIATGQLSRISYQAMEQLFGEHAETIKNKWQRKFGVQFFYQENAQRAIAVTPVAYQYRPAARFF